MVICPNAPSKHIKENSYRNYEHSTDPAFNIMHPEDNNNKEAAPNYQTYCDVSRNHLPKTFSVDKECSSSNSSPVLDFRERRLAFEKPLNESNLSSAPKSKILRKNLSSVNSTAVSTAPLPKLVKVASSPKLGTRKISPTIPTKPSFLVNKTTNNARHSPSNSDTQNASLANNESHLSSNSSNSSKTSSPITPRETNLENSNIIKSCKIQSDGDSDKEIDVTEINSSLDNLSHIGSNLDELDGTGGRFTERRKQSSSEDSLPYTRDSRSEEEIPVFCVQQYFNNGRGRIKEPQRNAHSRSLSVGAELKNRKEELKYDNDDTCYVRRRTKTSNEFSNKHINNQNSNDFKDKQKMIEAVIKKGNSVDNEKEAKLQSSPKKTNVFRKISFTSKLDKDLQNKIAKGNLEMKGMNSTGKYTFTRNNDTDSSNNAINKLSRILPKLNHIPNSLRQYSSSHDDEAKAKDGSTNTDVSNIKHEKHKVKNGEISGGHFNSKLIGKEIAKELKENHFLEKKSIIHPPKRKTFSETDLIKLRSISSSAKQPDSAVNVDNLKPKPDIFPKSNNITEKLVPIKPSQIYNTRHPEQQNYLDESNNSAADDGTDSGNNDPPVRPPRRRNSASPRKKSKAPQPPTESNSLVQPVTSSPVDCKPANDLTASVADCSRANSPVSNDELCNGEESTDHSSTESLKTVLPQGPPPRKPPRTFAYEIYNNNKKRRLSKSSSESLAVITSDSKDGEESLLKSNSQLPPSIPIYAIPHKKKDSHVRNASLSENVQKPTIAPKPAHIKAISTNKRFSLVEPSLFSDLKSDSYIDAEKIKNAAQLRLSFRRNPPSNPPPEPPSNPKPSSSSNAEVVEEENVYANLGVDVGPVSLQACHSSHYAHLKDATLNRQMSMSDETLASSSGYGRMRDSVEPIYATPDLRAARARGGSGGELHYLCSDLFVGSDGATDTRDGGLSSDEKKASSSSRSNIIAAWKQEFRHSCRQMQHRLKKTVIR